MRSTLLTSTLFLLLLCSCKGGKAEKQEKINIANVAMSDTVYVCTSEGAKRFHATDTCKGLSNCGEEIVPATREEAEKKNRTYCHKCYEQQ